MHDDDNYQKTVDHPSEMMKACQIACEYISWNCPLINFQNTVNSDEVLLFWIQRVLLLWPQPPERYLLKTAGKTACVVCFYFRLSFCFQLPFFFYESKLPVNNTIVFFLLQMDSEGFIPLGLIASFYRVQALTQDINLIIEVCIPLQMLLLQFLSYIKRFSGVFQG